MRAALLLVALCAASAPAAAKPPRLPPYPKALRCAALTEASATLAKGGAEESLRFDQALFWGMAASEAARKAKRPSADFTRDQRSEGGAALARLKAADEAALADLEDCRRQVPPLNGRG